jgi:hypothetical protein
MKYIYVFHPYGAAFGVPNPLPADLLSNSYGYFPQTIEKMPSLSHLARYDHSNPTGSQIRKS